MTDAQPSTVTDYDDLIGRLNLAAKVRLLTGAATLNLYAEESIGLGELRLSDGRPESGD
jgi:beta-glucosidase